MEGYIKKEDRKKKKILLISQPNFLSGSFESLFSLKIGKKRLIDLICEAHKISDFDSALSFRPHPKDSGYIKLPKEIKIDNSVNEVT